MHYGRNRLCRASHWTAKRPIRTAKALPCVHARHSLHGKVFDGKAAFAVRMDGLHGNALCRASPSLPCAADAAVRGIFAVRRHRCRAPLLCRAPYFFAVRPALPCATMFAVRRFAVRPCSATHGKEPCRHAPQELPGAQLGDTWPLCRACAHGKETKCPLPCAHTRQRGLVFSFFCYFSIIPAFQILHFTNIAYITYIST
jgi:hypothetical protein